MTARQVFEGLLTELSKVNAPSMLLQDFNYFFNKAVNQYINKRYNIYDIAQQTTDDLRVLKATSVLDVTKSVDKDPLKAVVGFGAGKSKLLDATFETELPSDYMHLLNCVCIYKVNKNWKCYNAGDYVQFSATRLTSDSWSNVINDYYRRPLPERPYYYIHNVNEYVKIPTDPFKAENANAYKISIEDSSVNKFVSAKPTGLSYHVTRKVEVALKDEEGNVKYDEEGNILTTIETRYLTVNGPLVKLGDTDVYRIDTTVNLSDAEITAGAKVTKDRNLKGDGSGTDMNGTYSVTVILEAYLPGDAVSGESPQSATLQLTIGTEGNSNLPRTVKLNNGGYVDAVEKETAVRYGNSSKVRMEIRYGHDSSVFTLVKVFVDYIKTPQFIRLTQELVNLTEDTSLIMEFPDYVCLEIINELVTLVMENTADPRLQTHPVVSKSIAEPAQQLAAPQATRQQS